MKKGITSYIATFALTMLGLISAACNSANSTWGVEPQDYSGTAVTAFSLKVDGSVLNNLDSVFFSIDQNRALIFNASPLPYGTEIDSLAVSISSNTCSACQLIVPATTDKEEVTVDYLTNPDSFLDFSRGPVTLKITSADGEFERSYQIRINVAKDVADSLYWDKLNAGALKTVNGFNRSRTVKAADKAYTLSTSPAGNALISVFVPATDNGGGQWGDTYAPRFNNAAAPSLDTQSFSATESGLFCVLGTDGTLYTSTDFGRNFTTADHGWKAISAPYTDGILGVKNNAGSLSYACWPSSIWAAAGNAIDPEFPVTGASDAAVFTTKWAVRPQAVIAGGRTAAGEITGASWSFDGNKWARISTSLPAGEGWSLSRYTIAVTDSDTWDIERRDVLVALGGMNAEPCTGVYVSRDMGVTWVKGSKELQLPDYIPFATGASLLCFDKTLTESGTPGASTLAVKPITEWPCPYLYLFGGYTPDGTPLPQYWSGVVNYLTRKPIQ